MYTRGNRKGIISIEGQTTGISEGIAEVRQMERTGFSKETDLLPVEEERRSRTVSPKDQDGQQVSQ